MWNKTKKIMIIIISTLNNQTKIKEYKINYNKKNNSKLILRNKSFMQTIQITNKMI